MKTLDVYIELEEIKYHIFKSFVHSQSNQVTRYSVVAWDVGDVGDASDDAPEVVLGGIP